MTVLTVNYCIMSEPAGFDSDALLEEVDKKGIERGMAFKNFGSAYAIAHATRPATMGIVLNSNPLALLAWWVQQLRSMFPLLFATHSTIVSGLEKNLCHGPMMRHPLIPLLNLSCYTG